MVEALHVLIFYGSVCEDRAIFQTKNNNLNIKNMRKIDLNELYGGYWSFYGGLDYDGRGGELEIKPLREHLEEWVKSDWECIKENKEHIQNILDGTEDLEVDDECTGGFGYRTGYEDEYGGAYEDEVRFEPLSEIKKEREAWAREQGIKPRKCWHEAELDRLYDDLPY
jgi:hypothetical protein